MSEPRIDLRRTSLALVFALPAAVIPLCARPVAAGLQFSDQIRLGIREDNEPSDLTFTAVIPQIGLGITPGAVALKEASGQVSDVLSFEVLESTLTGPMTLLRLHVQSVDGAAVPTGAALLKETGGFQDLDGKFLDGGGNPIRIPFGISFMSATSETGPGLSEGLLLSFPPSFESAVSGMALLGDFPTAEAKTGAVVLHEPVGEGTLGAVSDVIIYTQVPGMGTGVIFQSEREREALGSPQGATNLDENGHLQDITSKFTDADKNSVTLPFDIAVESDIIPEPSTLVLLSASLCIFGVGRLRRAIISGTLRG